jgi:hypothetical protein
MRRISALSGLLVLALAHLPVAAQVLYKSTMPDGQVIYGDKPAPGAVKVESSKPDISKKGIAPPTKGEAETLKKLEAARLKREAAQGKVESAEKALRDAEAARAAGVEPQAGERQGTASGNQRFTDAYWERQKKLEQDVQTARRNLEQARSSN